MELSSKELSLITRYAMLSTECKLCVDLLLDAAIGYENGEGTVMHMIARATEMK